MVDQTCEELIDLEKKLNGMKEDLVGSEEMLLYTLCSTGHHIAGSRRKKCEADVEELRRQVSNLESDLHRAKVVDPDQG